MCDSEEYEDIESGPRCMHYYDLGDCDLLCICGHKCGVHWDDVEGCREDDCKCVQYEDADPQERAGRGLPELKKEEDNG